MSSGMSFGKKVEEGGKGMEPVKEDPQVEHALKHFRESMKAWSEHEMSVSRKPAPMRSGFFSVHVQLVTWVAAAAMAITVVATPFAYYHHRDFMREQQQAQEQQARRQADEAARERASAMDDEELLKHVDRDIAQQTPDAMESLASLMTDEKTN